MTTQPRCQARYEGGGMMRCVACRLSWDTDDIVTCPRLTVAEAPPLAPDEFVSALAPDPFMPSR